MADKPVTREEKYLAYLTGDYKGELPKPITRKEKYLYELCLKGIGGEISPEEIKNAVNEYLEKNPVKPGATTEQAQQIEQNKTDIASLKVETDSIKEDISNKITKFYASNQGETHLADSDSEKIVDMMMYGKSEQVSTTGSQLLDLSVTPNAHRNQYVFDKKTGIYTHTVETVYDSNRWIISSNPNTDMIISCKNIENGMRIEVSRFLQNEVNSTICIIDSSNKKATFNTKTWNEFTISIFGYATGKQTAEDIMLEKGTEAHSYEPYTGGQPSPSPDYPQEIKSVVNPTVKVCGKNLLQPNLRGNDRVKINIKKGVKLTLIFKNSAGSAGGNLKFKKANGEIQWFEFDKGSVKQQITLEDNVVAFDYLLLEPSENYALYIGDENTYEQYKEQSMQLPITLNAIPVSSGGNVTIDGQQYIADYVDVERGKLVKMVDSSKLDNTQSIANKTEWLLAEPQEIDLTQEEVQTLKALATYYPTTNIFINSEQLDGMTVFNYPISMANGWNYVKQQLNDNRDYIYDMDTNIQDIDTQSAEAYVNSEYAVVLTELEVQKMLYKALKKLKERNGLTDDLKNKIDVFFAVGRITEEQYNKLMDVKEEAVSLL